MATGYTEAVRNGTIADLPTFALRCARARKGYTRDNVVLCTSIVNRVKQNLTYEGLLDLCRRLIRHSRKEG